MRLTAVNERKVRNKHRRQPAGQGEDCPRHRDPDRRRRGLLHLRDRARGDAYRRRDLLAGDRHRVFMVTGPGANSGVHPGLAVELRKVVWPNRQETAQTTMVIIFFVIIMGIFFWLLDMFLAWAARMLTGQGAEAVALRWYVVHAYSNFEHKVKESLRSASSATGWSTSSARSWCRPRKWSRCARARSARASASSSPATCWCRWSSTTRPGTW
jgi:preprotein translocase SecE subunit